MSHEKCNLTSILPASIIRHWWWNQRQELVDTAFRNIVLVHIGPGVKKRRICFPSSRICQFQDGLTGVIFSVDTSSLFTHFSRLHDTLEADLLEETSDSHDLCSWVQSVLVAEIDWIILWTRHSFNYAKQCFINIIHRVMMVRHNAGLRLETLQCISVINEVSMFGLEMWLYDHDDGDT